ncbi:uncharacterized protein PG986_014457 [Apiospora aurea]|uniref:Zn(2)-C6 fungal-type domain-containing protein n=1 Tax=Apiospora aurea TaxID=335848 RepID=A0ABR1PT19_9PEZI
MDSGPPEAKRPRLTAVDSANWQTLPPLPAPILTPYHQCARDPLVKHHRSPPSFNNRTKAPQYPPLPAICQPKNYLTAPPTPVQLSGRYAPQPHMYGPHAPSPEVPYPAPVAIATAKRKAPRASQACDSCRQLKAKCDELKPCKNCKEKGIQCNYRETPAKQPDKVSADILEIIQSLKTQMTSLDDRMIRMDKRVESNLKRMDNKLDRALTNAGSLENVKMESVEDNDDLAQSPADLDTSQDEHDGEEEIQSDRETNGEPAMTKEAADQVFQQANEIEIEQEPEPPKRSNTSTSSRYDKSKSEEPHYNDLMTDVNDMDGQGSDAPTPPPGENWGQFAPLNDPSLSLYKGGPLNVDGTPDFDHSKLRKYVQSFKDNILCMHPTIVPKELDVLVAMFLYSLPRDKEKQATSAPPSAEFVGASSAPSATMPESGTKRKRSPAVEDANQPVSLQKANLPFRGIHSALVLSVLALEKICLHKGKLPDLVNEHDNANKQSPSVRNGVPVSPLQRSQGSPPGAPPHPPQLSGRPSP